MQQHQAAALSRCDSGGQPTVDSIISRLQAPIGTVPSDVAKSVAGRPVLSSAEREWQDLSLERFQMSTFDFKLGASCVHRVGLMLAGPVLIERTWDGRRDRRWAGNGCTYLVPAGVPMTCSVKGQADFLVSYVTSTIVNEVVAEVFDLDSTRVELVESLAAPDEIIDRISRLLLFEAESGGMGTRLFSDTITRALALHLIRAYSTKCRCAPVSQPGPLIGWKLRRTIECMRANLAENLPLAQLAAAAELSPSHFTRAFRAAVGEPPHRHLIRLRMEQARSLLEHTRLPIIEESSNLR